MTNKEKILVHMLKDLNQDKETTIGIILALDEKEQNLDMMIEYLKGKQANQITTTEILDKVLEIRNNE